MSIQSSDSRSTSRVLRVTEQDGKTQDVCHVSGCIKDGRLVSVQVSVLAPSSVAACMADVQDQVMSFVSAVFSDAALTGIPVRPMSEAT